MLKSNTATAVLAATCFLLISVSTDACPYSLRDAAFLHTDGSPEFALLVVLDENPTAAEEAFATRIRTLGEERLKQAGISLATLKGTAALTKDFGFPSEQTPDQFPIALLVGEGRDPLVIDTLAPIKSDEELSTILNGLIDSPVRRKIRDALSTSWGVLAVVSASACKDVLKIKGEIEQANEQIIGSRTELRKRVENGAVEVKIPLEDPAETVTRWSLGFAENTNESQVALVAGRGRRRGPILVGEQITTKGIHQMLEMLGRSCSCTRDPIWSSGPTLPLVLTEDFDAAVEGDLGFDPRDPQALFEVRQAHRNAPLVSADDLSLGYSETPIYAVIPTGNAESSTSISSVSPQVKLAHAKAAVSQPTPPEKTSSSDRYLYVGLIGILSLVLVSSVVAGTVVARRRV